MGKRLLEQSEVAADEIAAAVGYDNAAFFRRLFKRATGLTAGQYRRMFQPIATAGEVHRPPTARLARAAV